jgi:homocysteine S-methyltransferase
MGPLGVRIEPFGPIARTEAREVFAEQAQALAAGGVDLLILETFGHLPELEEAIRGVRSVTDLPLVAQVAVAKRGVTREGVDPGEAASRMVAAGASVVGVNCSEALAVLDALEGMSQAVSLPLSAQPNAGQPHTVDGRNLYLASPDYLVAWGRQAIRAGARLLGGCCGTTPDHIRALRQAVGAAPPVAAPVRATRPVRPSAAVQPVPTAQKSPLAGRLLAGDFVTGIELPLPIGWEVDAMASSLIALAERGVEFATLLDGPRTEARMSPTALAQVCLRRGGLDPIVQMSCRERRLSRLQSDLLGAYATGIANLLIVTGPPSSPAVDAPPDLEVDSIGAVNLVGHLNHGQDIGGTRIGRPTGFFTGVRLDPSHYDRAREIARYQWKVSAGAEFAVTAPIFDPAGLEALLEELPERVPVIATVWPLRSAREAQFFELELSEVPVPAPLQERMQAAETAGREREEGIAIARELAAALRPLVNGLQVVAPDGDLELAAAVLE